MGEYDNVQDAFFKCYVDIIFNSRDDWCVFILIFDLGENEHRWGNDNFWGGCPVPAQV